MYNIKNRFLGYIFILISLKVLRKKKKSVSFVLVKNKLISLLISIDKKGVEFRTLIGYCFFYLGFVKVSGSFYQGILYIHNAKALKNSSVVYGQVIRIIRHFICNIIRIFLR